MRIVSGGQTGVDRGALDAARALGIPHGGWCPRGRKAEDGPIPPEYELQEASTARYAQRTELNVRDSDGTLILTVGDPTGGTALTARLACQLRRPLRIVDLDADEQEILPATRAWIAAERIETLNVAGPRESTLPGARKRAERLVRLLLARAAES